MKVTQALLKELLHYDPKTGHFTWRDRDRSRFKSDGEHRRWNTRYAWTRAGTLTTKGSGYRLRKLMINKRLFTEHRLAFLYMKGRWPKNQIDHDNRDGTDNRWVNLVETDPLGNQKNRSKNINNTSGHTGVYWIGRRSKWMARVCVDGKSIYLGYYEDIAVAIQRVAECRAQHGFHPDHGAEHAPYHLAGN